MRFLLTIAVFFMALSAQAQRWELQSNFWVNVHQALFDEAQSGKHFEAQGMSELETKLWRDSVNTYRVRFYDRSPIFDDELVRINDALSTATDLPPEGFAEPVTKALLSAAPVYRKYRWTADDRSNKFWISVAGAMIRDAGDDLARDHSKVYGIAFPTRVRVDVSATAGTYGAYTSDGGAFVHTTISSRDPRYQGYAALEMLLHEASHAIAGAANGAIGSEIASVGRNANPRLLPPRELWHAILFYTSGELTRRALVERGIDDYTPFVYKQQMFDRVFFGLREPIEAFWLTYLDGRMQREAAITAIVQATANQAPPRNGG